ncbi:MAG: hypothetical protein MUP36_02460, partial [Demequinaceae bacterium]|nr:hypothetical protein [Demequinaceae bacterium]
MDDRTKTPDENGTADGAGPIRAFRRAGRVIVEGTGTGVAATARGVRALGRGMGASAGRVWSGLTTGRAQ